MNNNFAAAVQKLFIPADTELLPQADLAFIFGNQNIIDELAVRASQLYHSSQVKNILATGGVCIEDGRTEARALQTALQDYGVPENDIIAENHSQNTEENITLGKKLVDTRLGLENIHSLISLGHAAAGPRFTMTLAKRWPSVLPMHISVFPKNVDPQCWWEDADFLERARRDAAKLSFYSRSNYIHLVTPREINDFIRSSHLTTPVQVQTDVLSLAP